MHCAKVSHVVLADDEDVHGCPSAMTVGQVGLLPPASMGENAPLAHEPTRQIVDSPSQGCPAAASVGVTHVPPALQLNPDSHWTYVDVPPSVLAAKPHAAPACAYVGLPAS